MTPETHKCAAAAGTFCFVTKDNGDQQDICNLTTMPSIQRSLYLNEMTNNFSVIQVEVPKVTFSRQKQDGYREVSKSNRRNINRQILLPPQDPDFG